jgi:hypothetical protein
MTWLSSGEHRPAGLSRRLHFSQKHVRWKLDICCSDSLPTWKCYENWNWKTMILCDVERSSDQFFLNRRHATCLQFDNLSTVEVQTLPGMLYIDTALGSASYVKAPMEMLFPDPAFDTVQSGYWRQSNAKHTERWNITLGWVGLRHVVEFVGLRMGPESGYHYKFSWFSSTQIPSHYLKLLALPPFQFHPINFPLITENVVEQAVNTNTTKLFCFRIESM